MLWKIKFAWMYFWRDQNEPTGTSMMLLIKTTNNCSNSPSVLLRNNFLDVPFWQDVPHFIFESGMTQGSCKQPHLPWDQSQI